MIRILLVNPSFGSDTEQEFWDLIEQGCESGDLHVHSFSMRRVTHPESFDAEIHSARLTNYGRGGGTQLVDRLRIRSAPSWWSPTMSELQVDWERRRWPEKVDELYALRGVHRLVSVADKVLDKVKPDLVLTTNKIDHPCVIFRKAAQARSISTALVERSPFSGIWLESNGLFAESQIPGAWARSAPTPEHARLGQSVLDYLRAEPATFRAAEDKAPAEGEESAGADASSTLLLLMDNALWTGWAQPNHPQRAIDYPYLDSPQQAVDLVAELARQRGMQVLIRPHPSCRDQLTWQLPTNAVMSRTDLTSDLAAAAAVVAFNTKVTFSAAAFGLPVATLAPNPIEASGYSHIVRSDDELQQFLDAVTRGDDLSKAHDFDSFVGWMASDYMLAERGAPRAATADGIVQRLQSLVTVPDEAPARATGQARQPSRGKNITIVELSRLENKKLRYSGIAVAQRSLARELAQLPDSNSYFLIETEVGAASHGVDVLGLAELATATRGRVLVANRKDRDRLLATMKSGDVYHSTHRELPASKLTGAAQRALTIHDVIHEHRPDLDALPGIPYITKLLDRSDKVDLYLCDSDQTRRDLIRARGVSAAATRVVELGTEAQRNCPKERFTAAPYVLVLAQVSRRKNMAKIAKALDLLTEDTAIGKDVALVIAGGDAAIHSAIKHLSPASMARVRLCSEPSQPELGQLFRDAEVCLFGSEFEGFGLIPLEAMAYGCPVVTPWNSSLGEVCGSAVEYALSANPDDLYRATRNVLLAPELRAELREQGLRRAESYSWKSSALAHLAVYDELRLAALTST